MRRISPINGAGAIVWLAVVSFIGCSDIQDTASEVQASVTGLSQTVAEPSIPMQITDPETRVLFDFPVGALMGWEAQTGLRPPSQALGAPPPEDVWQSRIWAACDAPIWEQDEAQRLAEQYVSEDGGDTESIRLLEDAAASLWLIAIQVCRENFPPEAIDRGPRFAFSP